MAKKKSKNKSQARITEGKSTSSSTRVLQIFFIVFSILIVLSMVLAAAASFY